MLGTIVSFLDWRGRIGRGAYRAGLLATLLINEAVAFGSDASPATRVALTALAFAFVLLLEAKRFHDVGLGAAWIVWVNLATIPLGLAIEVALPGLLARFVSESTLPLPPALTELRFYPAIVFGIGLASSLKSLWLSFAPSAELPQAPPRLAEPADSEPGASAAMLQALEEAIVARKHHAIANGIAPQKADIRARPTEIVPPRRTFGQRGAPAEKLR